ncbi:hypothetical protein HPB48_013643 [Haemaphysalis longicornis]|uniref:Regulator of G protein signalling-like domain-containing protein n=1 Tax=Haemaphysalis longicornis TaxID=44386 RepID=A0A9J6FX19_HAELO|nr:hypothetical protein HPB48_013643 [Haemaphysalis longicornis]
MITNLYKLGTGKEMKKWAYEITSTFLVQSAPLSIENIDEAILKEIDKVLQSSQEQGGQEEEELKDVFLKAREKAMEQLKRLLTDFRNTRTIGLSGLYMPNDVTLDDALRDKNVELRIIESTLLNELETLAREEPENLTDYKSALASALATVLKSFGVKTPSALALMERFPTFVAREKSRLKLVGGDMRDARTKCRMHAYALTGNRAVKAGLRLVFSTWRTALERGDCGVVVVLALPPTVLTHSLY